MNNKYTSLFNIHVINKTLNTIQARTNAHGTLLEIPIEFESDLQLSSPCESDELLQCTVFSSHFSSLSVMIFIWDPIKSLSGYMYFTPFVYQEGKETGLIQFAPNNSVFTAVSKKLFISVTVEISFSIFVRIVLLIFVRLFCSLLSSFPPHLKR